MSHRGCLDDLLGSSTHQTKTRGEWYVADKRCRTVAMGASMRWPILLALLLMAPNRSLAADLIVSANDGKFVRVEGNATYPQPAPPDSLAVIDASVMPPKIVTIVAGIEHTI